MGTVTALTRSKRRASPQPLGPVRPMPPLAVGTEPEDAPLFQPDPSLNVWVAAHLLDEGSPLFNPDHEHLRHAIETLDVCFLWAATATAKQGRMVLGTAESVMFRAGGWQKERQEWQMVQWFGCVPPFLITLAADYCATCTDDEFLRLLEHELYHIAHATDAATGEPLFDRLTGLPKLRIRGHDVEEFVGVVRRYGAPAEGMLRDLIDAATDTPTIGQASVAAACGTCLARAA